MKSTFVSVIVTTRNEEKNIKTCLTSIINQTYKNLEIIVVDNNSTDRTKKITEDLRRKTEDARINFYNKGPERSAQRNFGAEKAKGKYVLFIDADMKLSKDVVSSCVKVIESEHIGGVIIPEESYGIGFWAECKKLERSFYIGNDLIEAARFYKKDVFEKVGGFDLTLTGPEDWDLSQKVRKKYKLGRTKELIYHNEGKLSLSKTLQKKYYYAKKLKAYSKMARNKKIASDQLSISKRYGVYFSKPTKLFPNPLLSVGMLFMKTCEFGVGGIGYITN